MNKYKSELPVVENKTYEVVINDLSHEGLGVARVDNYPVFIENALPGEKVKIMITHTGKRMGHGYTVEILEKSPHRVENIDEIHIQSGTMPLLHLAYDQQLKFKQDQVAKLMKKVGRLEGVTVLDTMGMDNPFGYRNKAQIPVREVDGELTTGFYKKKSHDLIPM